MDRHEAEAEASRRWCKSARSGRTPAVAVRGDQYRVGYSDGEFIYWLGSSPAGFHGAFEDADRRRGEGVVI